MSASRVADRPLRRTACLTAAALALSGCDADPHVPAIVRAPAPAPAPPAASAQPMAAPNGLAPPVLHTVD
ncbi:MULTISPECIES: hypothetical protein [Ralstonia]|uniref:hypothetical protein n=1 Tax=Ralstonia TaxID=48736 RepID=UPI000C7B708E|nr:MULTISPECIES: hypothetical protein [Ralstonia]PLT16607.1 hypothetical protein CXP34_21035 [Ralstonia mannitolilytica]